MSAAPPALTAQRLREVLEYDPVTGRWAWLIRRGYYPIGFAAGTIMDTGYRKIRVDGRQYFSARLAWLYMTGGWPQHDVDHKDCDPLNDRWSNLRAATQTQNNGNTRRYKNNKSGFKGVSWHARRQRWEACICVNGKTRYLGYFDDPVDAHNAYMHAAVAAFGEFARAE